LDLEGKVKFGPDVEWLGGKGQVGEREAREDPEGFWTRFLEPSEGRMEEMHRAIQTYVRFSIRLFFYSSGLLDPACC
jgi:2-hydroxyglutarate dehydrogenase